MSIFLSYIFLGLSLSAPIGPINAAQLDKGIRNGFFHAWLIGVGAMAADALYMLLIYFGIAQFLSTPFIKTFLWLFGFFVLVYTGIETLKGLKEMTIENKRTDELISKSFSVGFFMALSNPLNILFWLGIYGSILAKTVDYYGTYQLFFYSSGIFIGILIWDIVMAAVASTCKHYLNRRPLQIISLLAGISLICFGIYFGFEACKQLFL
ncbi:LysE family translocator [Bacillus taeanensis]|uniref:Amino acid transporter n=1 Tax=Bacillus taeanensis TaxID=273032 RepID=A0A366XUK1_9BACI|nr:LysE family translocator [Bacillus taeanensis]RBW69248.1 amino acid transporter [Bacillus taeanensis]